MTWHDPNPDVHADFADAFYDEMAETERQREAIAARLANHGPAPSSPIFAADPPSRREARPLTTAGSAGPAARPHPPAAPRDRRTPSERAA